MKRMLSAKYSTKREKHRARCTLRVDVLNRYFIAREVEDPDISFSDVVRTVACSGNVIKCGYLTKKRWKIGRSQRYFVLRDDAKLYYYKTQNDSNAVQKCVGVVQLKDVYIIPHGWRVFSIHSNNGVWTLRARTTEERNDWMKKLKFARACMQAKEDNELTQLKSTNENGSFMKSVDASNILPDLDKQVKELLKCAAMLTVRNAEITSSEGDQSNGKSPKVKERVKDLSLSMSINFKSFKHAARRCLLHLRLTSSL
ncbi:unnamed protein product [Anisakis simplex]|uniref:PH domain-containing protein n=1 Tax=Anisakis simplex TaxID=6269 RepID=A0A0M3K7J0_ANISI|nr:unnamed protein product [Anisakis simplex]